MLYINVFIYLFLRDGPTFHIPYLNTFSISYLSLYPQFLKNNGPFKDIFISPKPQNLSTAYDFLSLLSRQQQMKWNTNKQSGVDVSPRGVYALEF